MPGKSKSMDICLQADQIEFRYEGATSRPVFSELSLAVGKGSVFCLLGPNGTGKSTLLKCLCGLLQCGKGRILLNGNSIRYLGPTTLAQAIGYVPQSQVPVFPYAVEEVVVMGRAPHLKTLAMPSKTDYQKAGRAMDAVGITHLARRPCTRLSGGEWQLTLLARALVQEAQLLILDEPTSHLDVGNQVKILHTIQSLAAQGLTIVMATHFPDHALWTADQVAVLNQGRITIHGAPDEVLTSRTLKDVYGVDIKVLEIAEGTTSRICLPQI